MLLISEFLRKIAAEVVPEKFEAHEIRIFFRAPSLESLKTKRTPTITEDTFFYWTALWLYFYRGEKYYIYRLTLTPEGNKGDRHTVHDSDSTWTLKNIKRENSPESEDILPTEVEKNFKEILGDPGSSRIMNFEILEKKAPTTYINQDENNKEYSTNEFKKTFINSKDTEGKPYYKLFSKKPDKEKKNPFGKVIGIKFPEKKEVVK